MRKILLSLMLIAAVVALIGGGTFAYFSSDQTSSGNQFTAGTLHLQLSNNGADWGNGVSATWKSPSNWAPGDEVAATIYLKNTGTVPAQVAYGDWRNGQAGGGQNGANLLNEIEVTEWKDSVDNYQQDYLSNFMCMDANHDGHLSLAELINGDTTCPGSLSGRPWEAAFFANPNDPALPPPLLPAGGTYGLRMKYKFMEDAGNDYQGAWATFDLLFRAAQKANSVQPQTGS